MNFYWIKTRSIIRFLFPKYLWRVPQKNKVVYLTFDDGPTPGVTEWTLAQLARFGAKATFFCIGSNIRNHPDIFSKIVTGGHTIGNHTFNHLNGWKTDARTYIENVKACGNEISKRNTQSSVYFRPPYGKVKSAQATTLRKMGYKIVMWDILSADFDSAIMPEQCLRNVLNHISAGSIVIFHDSVKAFKNLEYALPETLKFLSDNGYRCDVLP